MTFILACAAVYSARFKAGWKLKRALQMHLHRCRGLVLFFLFKHIYIVGYQHLNSSRISWGRKRDRVSPGKSWSMSLPALS